MGARGPPGTEGCGENTTKVEGHRVPEKKGTKKRDKEKQKQK